MSSTIPISGICHDQFELVESAFRSNFTGHGEVGARVSVIKDGEIVVDLCGGHTTETKQQLWDESTLIVCMSVTKGVVALAAHLLAERDQLNYDAPVAEYWPEFQSNGKSAITVRQAMACLLTLKTALLLDTHLTGLQQVMDLVKKKSAWLMQCTSAWPDRSFGVRRLEFYRRLFKVRIQSKNCTNIFVIRCTSPRHLAET